MRIIKRKRALPYRKWTDYETEILVEYINKNDFEKPCARIFYQKFVQTYNMKIEWTLAKNKIRNLRNLYKKAVAWQRSDAAQNVPDGESVQSMVNRMCPLFDSLKEVFGGGGYEGKLKANPNQYHSNLQIDDSEDTVFKSTYSPPSSPHNISEQGHQTTPIRGSITVSENIIKESVSPPASVHQTSIQPENLGAPVDNNTNFYIESSHSNKTHDPCNCLVELVKMMASNQKDMSEYQKARLELEHKKFDFEKERTFRDLDLRQREIEKNERLQVLEIESKERIALKELEYKYKRF